MSNECQFQVRCVDYKNLNGVDMVSLLQAI